MNRHDAETDAPRCGLCGKKGELIKTECCGQWICDDEVDYVPFSYDRNSCSRNHRCYTLPSKIFRDFHLNRFTISFIPPFLLLI